MDRITIKIINEQSIDYAANEVLVLAAQMGFDKLACNLISSAVSEIATNSFKYAKKGQMEALTSNNKKGIDIVFKDQGPGIKDIQKVMVDGYSSRSDSLGVGMGAAQRAMDYFDIDSSKNGTTISMGKWLPIPKASIEFGVVSIPDIHYQVNGDGYVIKELYGDSALVGLIDGLGEGIDAFRTTNLLKKVIAEVCLSPLNVIIKVCEEEIRKIYPDSGAAIALLRIKPFNLEYAGVGDTFINVFPEDVQFYSQEGIVGPFNLPNIKVSKKPYMGDLTIVLCTDGIKDSFETNDLPMDSNAQDIAENLVNSYRRDHGDATVLVIRIHMEHE